MAGLARVVCGFALVCLLALVVVGASAGSVDAAPANPSDVDPRLTEYPEVTFTVTATGIEGPETVAAGRTLVVQENMRTDLEATHFFLLRVPDEVTDGQLAAADFSDVTNLPEWFYGGTMIGNPDRAAPNGGQVFGVVDFVVGRYIVMNPTADPVLVSRFDVVAPANGDLPPAPVADVTATNFEMDFTINGPVPAGRQVWEIVNTGALLHEMAIVPVPSGATDADVIKAFGTLMQGNPIWTAELGPEWAEWSENLVNGSGAMSGGQTVWVQFNLQPGTYAAVCFVPGAGFMPHLMEGMVQVFTVA